MARCSLFAIAAAATLVLAACSEREPDSPTGPELAGGTVDPCAFSNSLISNYFPGGRQSTIISLKQSMANAGHGTTDARTAGFQIMDSIGSVSRNFSVSPAAGAQLTVALIPCMFDNASSFTYPTDSISAFTKALSNTAGGAYFVRGGGTNGVDNLGRDKTVLGTLKSFDGTTTNLSGMKPSSGSWTTMLPGTGIEQRALIYGYQVTASPLVYEWATVPSALTFSPEVVISVCDGDASQSAMVHEGAVGVLAYVSTSICNDTQSLTTIERGWGPNALAARVGGILLKALAPTPLQATVVLTGTGGKTSTVPKSQFGKQSVTTLALAWNDQPPAVINGTKQEGTTTGTTFPVSFTVDASGPIFGTCAYLAGTNNNGTLTKLIGPHDSACTLPPNGDANALSVQLTARVINHQTVSIADFGQVGVTKTGGIIFLGSADVLDRIGSGSISTKSNVKPLSK